MFSEFLQYLWHINLIMMPVKIAMIKVVITEYEMRPRVSKSVNMGFQMLSIILINHIKLTPRRWDREE